MFTLCLIMYLFNMLFMFSSPVFQFALSSANGYQCYFKCLILIKLNILFIHVFVINQTRCYCSGLSNKHVHVRRPMLGSTISSGSACGYQCKCRKFKHSPRDILAICALLADFCQTVIKL